MSMEYHFSELFSWTSGKPITPTIGAIPVYGSNGVIGYTDKVQYRNRIILGRVGAYCGSVAYCPSEFNATDNTLITKCDTSKILYGFAYYLLKQFRLNDYAGGAAQPLITQGLLKHLKCDIPSIDQQLIIAEHLSAYDNLIEVNNKRIKVLEQLAENLYKEWFVRFRFPGHENAEFENGIPKGWTVEKIGGIVKRLPFGVLYKAEDTVSEGKVIVVDQSQAEYIGFHNNKPSHMATSKSPIALFGDHSCKQQLMITPFSLSENVVPFIGRCGINTVYLYYLTYRKIETIEYKRHWTEFTAKKVLVAPPGLQERFSDKVTPICETIQKVKEQNRNLIKQRDLLLPRLMSGKLEVRS